ncbi:MAG TPA: polysaccharide biosynthesis protein [Chloroflexia bacterium]|jgi:FlaA1/EpsC-like NDP-sugar epimerase/lipopolysaccharide/colanic/teichoic acid biosynthesis glycosyltransferase
MSSSNRNRTQANQLPQVQARELREAHGALRDAAWKRPFDVAGSLLALVLLSPVFLLVSLVVKLGDGGPVFHRGLRTGRHGQPFLLYKFRTMHVGAERAGPGITASEDARITSVGRWLRRTKLDELPQLLNVLRGEMSIVGPRPEDPRYVELYSPEERQILGVRPGITSAASLTYRNEEQVLSGGDWETLYRTRVMPDKLRIDLAYLARRTFGSDLRLILQTAALSFLPGVPSNPAKALLLGMRNRHFLAVDMLVCLITPALATMLRTDGPDVLSKYGQSLLVITPLFMAIKLAVFFRGGLYNRYWRYAGVEELGNIAGLSLIALAIQLVLFLFVLRSAGWISDDFPRSIPLLVSLLDLFFVGGVRFSVRLVNESHKRRSHTAGAVPVLIAGAGSAGVMIVDEVRSNPNLGMIPVGFVDDAPQKQGARIRGIPVLGRCQDIERVAGETKARHVIIAMPTAPGKTIREIVAVCERAGVQAKTVPGMYELLNGTASLKQIRDVDIEDLLRRDPVQTDLRAVGELIRGKRVLVTGGGGSIGSEICRQVLRYEPSMLLILGHGENSIFEIHAELTRHQQTLPEATRTRIQPIIADIRFADRIDAIFHRYEPEVVFHAAAHKHVPLMESNISEAITNNILGTRNLLESASAVGVEHFVMISSDKAVNPTSVMGVSKRIAELLVHQAAVLGDKHYVAVRFGNVLGSRGSVVLTFKQQIAMGGPVCVTHPEMVRYFMTIPESVQLVLQASTLGRGGEVFMLDMGEPVKIVDLARDLIELSGFEVGRDIDIVFTGMRPGEKLYEELFVTGEDYGETGHKKVYLVGNGSKFVPAHLDRTVGILETAAQHEDLAMAMSAFHRLVPSFQPVGYSVEGNGKGADAWQAFDIYAPYVARSGLEAANGRVGDTHNGAQQPLGAPTHLAQSPSDS